ncbi:Caspase-2, partial [Orchesella cincta]
NCKNEMEAESWQLFYILGITRHAHDMQFSHLTSSPELPKLLDDIMEGTTDKLIVDMNIPEIYKDRAHGDRPFIKGKRQALIMNIMNVKGMPAREGADVDSHYLEKLLPELGFDVHVVPESKLTKSGIEEEFQTFTNICVRDEVDCFVIYTGSHGMNDILFTADGKTLDIYSDLIYPFQFKVYEEKNGKSVEKPVVRVFINQSCQEEPSQFQRDAIKPESVDMKNTIYIKAQIPKYPAYRNTRFGSYFVLVLTFVFMKKAWDTSLLNMLYEVQVLLNTLTKQTTKQTTKRARLAQFPPILMMGVKDPIYFFKNPRAHFDVSHPVKIFTGSKSELRDLDQKFERQKHADIGAKAYTVSIVGMGGIGKSELARKYCREFVGAILWLNAETEETLTESFRILATEHLNIPSKNDDETEKSTATIITKVFMHFLGKPCLFVFDNLETDEILPKFKKFAQSNPSPPFVLITSQFKIRTTGNAEILELTEFTTEEAVELVKNCLKIQNEDQDENVLKLVRMMQRLPLALTHAISYISRESELWPNAFGSFLEQFRKSSKILFGTGSSPNLYTKTMYITFKMTLHLIGKRDHGEEAIKLLRILSYFQPDRILTGLFHSGKYRNALKLLLNFSVVIIQLKGVSIRIHRLMQDFMRMDLKENKLEEIFLEDALTILSQNASQDTAVHLFSVLKYCENMDALKDVVDQALTVHFEDPKIMTSFLSSSERVKYLTIEKNGENEKDWNVTMDLSDIVSIGRDPRQLPETYILSHALQTSQDAREKILSEPFVQLFMDLKWKKMQWPMHIMVCNGLLGWLQHNNGELWNWKNHYRRVEPLSAVISCLLVIRQMIKYVWGRNAIKYLLEIGQAVGYLLLTFVLTLVFLLGVHILIRMGWKMFYEENYSLEFPKCIFIITVDFISGRMLKYFAQFLIDFVREKIQEADTRVKILETRLEQVCMVEEFINWFSYPDLAETCRITGNKSLMWVWPLNCSKFLWGELNTTTPELQHYVENQFYVVKKPMTEFSSESRSLLMNLQAESECQRENQCLKAPHRLLHNRSFKVGYSKDSLRSRQSAQNQVSDEPEAELLNHVAVEVNPIGEQEPAEKLKATDVQSEYSIIRIRRIDLGCQKNDGQSLRADVTEASPSTLHFPSSVFPQSAFHPLILPTQHWNSKTVKFQTSWYSRFPWLHFNETLGKVLCFVCLRASNLKLHSESTNQDDAFLKTGFGNWRKGYEKFHRHESSNFHKSH